MFDLPVHPVLVLALLVAVIALGLALSYWRVRREIGDERAQLIAAARPPSTAVIAEERLLGLPAAAQRYLRHAGVVGKPLPRLVTLTQKGRIRSGPDARWMPLEADQIYSIDPPAFLWQVALPSRRLAIALGRDNYLGGGSSIRIRLLALIPVANEDGAALRKAGMLRYLNETMWFPAALLSRNVRLLEIDDTSFAAVLSDFGETVRGRFFVDDVGRLTNFRAQRYNTATRSIESWETPVSGYRDVDGYRVPTTGAACWTVGGRLFSYIELEVADITYHP